MHADDIPTDVTKLVYACPLAISKAVSQNEVAALLAHYWPAIEKHVRAAVVDEAATWLAGIGEADAAYMLRTCDIPTGEAAAGST